MDKQAEEEYYKTIQDTLISIHKELETTRKLQEAVYAKEGKKRGKYLYAKDANATAVEAILAKKGIIRYVKMRTPIGSSTIYEYMLNCNDETFEGIIVQIQETDLPVAWSWEKPAVIITLQ